MLNLISIRKTTRIASVIALAALTTLPKTEALAKSSENFINQEIKKAYIKDQAASEKANHDFVPTHDGPIDDEIYENYTPMRPSETVIRDARPLGLGEQPGSIDRPGGLDKVVDPERSVEAGVADKQENQRFRENYRDAVQEEFMGRARAAGVKTNKNIAEEIKAAETQKPVETKANY